MISLDEARSFVLESCAPLAVSRLPLALTLGCVLAQDIVAGEAVPPFANTAMDGFAVRASDTVGASADEPVTLDVVATLAAGHAADRSVQPGEAIRIMTGAPIPSGADAIVMVERTRAYGGSATEGAEHVEILVEVAAGNHIRDAGDDLQHGVTVFESGAVLTAGHLGVLASIGVTDVVVWPRPVVGVFSTGDELVQGDAALAPGQIRDSNRITLLSLLRRDGVDVVDLGCIPDDEDAIAAAIEDGAQSCDALITSGGVSMGDFDFVKVVLDRVGDMRWMQVAIKPAKPLAFGTVARSSVAVPDAETEPARRIPVFGLPGNPVSSMVSFELFALPGLRQMMGYDAGSLDRDHVVAAVDEPLRRRPDGKVHFARVVLGYDEDDAAYHVRSAGGQGSHHLTAMATANALAILPDGDGFDVGQRVRVMKLA